ncbi:hypothetical protein CFC21_019129 [Triticum aestivum]|uniref:Uncharacterized protein n=2 Tax=Triticum aestivum TaxID=4565 RepID=A0A3B6B4X1_WHEAT|nr:hypothetical protein CFC21_019129 [Triticum aestivum]
MKLSLALTLVAIFLLNIPPFEARPLGLGAHPSRHYHLSSLVQELLDTVVDRLRLSPLPRPGAAEEAGEAALVSYEPRRRSGNGDGDGDGDGDEEVAPGTPGDELRRSAARPPPPPPSPHYRWPAGRWGPVPGVGGSRRPYRPPAPSGQKPPHWRSSGDRSRPRPFDAFHALRVWSRMFL